MTLMEKVTHIIAEEDDEIRNEYIRKLTDNQKDIMIRSLVKFIREANPQSMPSIERWMKALTE